MKKLIVFLYLITSLNFAVAQIISSSINSSNILDYYDQTQLIKESVTNKSFDIAYQIGNWNVIQVNDQSPNYLGLLQNGNSNTILFNNPNNYPTNAEIIINGSGNYIDVLGSNSISDGMKININASDTEIYMKNY